MKMEIKLIDRDESFEAESVGSEFLSSFGTMVQYIDEDGTTVGVPMWRVEYVKVENY